MRVRGCIVVLWSLWLLLTTVQRVPIWVHERALWQEATEHSPEKPRPWINLGNAAADQGDVVTAEASYLHAIACAQLPTRGSDERILGIALASANLAILRWEAGQHDEARQLVITALDTAPHVEALRTLAQWMLPEHDRSFSPSSF